MSTFTARPPQSPVVSRIHRRAWWVLTVAALIVPTLVALFFTSPGWAVFAGFLTVLFFVIVGLVAAFYSLRDWWYTLPDNLRTIISMGAYLITSFGLFVTASVPQ